jgi:hypothetical protein
MAGWPPPPSLSSYLPLSYASAATRRTSPGAGAQGRSLPVAPGAAHGAPPPLPDPAAVLTTAAALRPPPIDPAATDVVLPAAQLGTGAGGADTAAGLGAGSADSGAGDLDSGAEHTTDVDPGAGAQCPAMSQQQL